MRNFLMRRFKFNASILLMTIFYAQNASLSRKFFYDEKPLDKHFIEDYNIVIEEKR